MNPPRTRIAIIFGVAVLGVLASALVQYRAGVELHRQNDRLRQQAEELARLSAENTKLSRLKSSPDPALSVAEYTELLRLRGQVGPLRGTAAELNELRATNRLLAASRTVEAGPPPGAVTLAHWSREELGNAGHDNPESTLKTVLWAMANGDLDTLVANMTPEMQAQAARSITPDQEMAAAAREMAQSLAPATGFRLIGKQIAGDHMRLMVFFEGEGKTRTIELVKSGAGWMFSSMGPENALQ